MKDKRKIIKSHYLSMNYKTLITNEIIHSLLFIIEVGLIFLQIIEIYFKDYKNTNTNRNLCFSPLTLLAIEINKLPITLKNLLHPIIIIFILINSYIL